MSKKRTGNPIAFKTNDLRKMREGAGLTVGRMGEHLGKNYSTLSKMELYTEANHPSYRLYWHAYRSVIDNL